MSSKFLLIRLGGRTALPSVFAFVAACWFSISSSQAAVNTAWRDFTDPSPFTANKPGLFSAATVTGTSVAIGGQGAAGGSFITESSGGALVIQLTPSASSGTVSLVSLSFHYNNATTSTITWTISGGNGGSEPAQTTLDQTELPDSGINWSRRETTVDLSSINGFTSSQPLTLIGTLSSGSGIVGFDTIKLSAVIDPVPEPINYALAGFGFIFVGAGAGRFYLARKKVSSVA
jgi:hypothetical protein